VLEHLKCIYVEMQEQLGEVVVTFRFKREEKRCLAQRSACWTAQRSYFYEQFLVRAGVEIRK